MINNQRKPVRLEGYDYSQAGAYFITICTFGRLSILGEINEQEMVCSLSAIGKIVQREILSLKTTYPMVAVEKHAVMPNHVHVILVINEENEPSGLAVGDVICALKSKTTLIANQIDKTSGRKIWQYRYHDHIIRTEEDLIRVYKYIDENPIKWVEDRYYQG